MSTTDIKNNINKLLVEKDMRAKPYTEEDPFSTKVLKCYPLIGDMIIKDETLERMHSTAKQYIDRSLNTREKVVYKQWVYEHVAIVVINYAKKWNSYEEGKFSRYIAMQFGYKDDSGRIWRIITEALEAAFKVNNKFFIKSANGDRHFYESVMSHSFGPYGSWTPLIELLFKFYTENLDWNYIPGDPLFSKLVEVLSKRFNHSSGGEEQFLIASNYYDLRIGIRRLVEERPGYCTVLFERIVRRIHQLIHNEAPETKQYSLLIVDDWFAKRLSCSDSIITKTNKERKAYEEVAFDYSRVSIKYTINNGVPSLKIPAIRIFDESNEIVEVNLYENNNKLETYHFEVFGNELGRTFRSQVISLPLNKLEHDTLNIRVELIRGNSILFDSDRKLYRQLLVFSEGKEVNPSKIHKEKYQIFAVNRRKLSGANLEISHGVNGICDVIFHKNYYLEYAGDLVAVDSADIQDIRIVKPEISTISTYMKNGKEYLIVSNNVSLKVYCSDKKILSKYSIKINGENRSLAEFYDTDTENRSVVHFDAVNIQGEVCIELVDLAANVIFFKEDYFIMPDYKVNFASPFYTSHDDYTNVSAEISIAGVTQALQVISFNEASVEYLGGVITITVPHVNFAFSGINKIFFSKYIRNVDITDDAVLQMSNHTGLPFKIIIGDNVFENDSIISLAWLKSIRNSDSRKIEIVLEIDGRRRHIAQIIYGVSFVSMPKLMLEENKLLWDGGQSYVGNEVDKLELYLIKSGIIKYSLPLQIGNTVVQCFENGFNDGLYECLIKCGDKEITKFTLFIGDEKKARFDDQIIEIDRITEDVEHRSEVTTIKTVYIDQIKYDGTYFVESENDVFDVYTGCMYWVNFKGEKKYYSFKYNDARSKYKINPVKIIFISKKYLRIVNEDDEGIYCYYNEFSREPGYEITDIEPTIMAKEYRDVLFYLYSTNSSIQNEHHNSYSNKSLVKETGEMMKKDVLSDETNTIATDKGKYVPNGIFEVIEITTQNNIISLPVETRTLINAGPGTGKTWTLIERIIHLVQEGVNPERIQVLCFSRAAVEVIRDRMTQAIQEERIDINALRVDIRTFDSFASQLLYWVKESEYKEISSSFRIEKLSYEDRIAHFVRIIHSQPQLIEQCRHLIVDEVQDLVLSRAEMVVEMIKQLPKDSGVTLFGDACQAIYDYQAEDGMKSLEFYAAIQRLGEFSCYSLNHNYRQSNRLQEYCEGYRNAILKNDMSLCNKELAKIYDDLPDYTVHKLKLFEEDSLDKVLKSGNVGILTRSNAQALMISNLFRKKNICHTIQRRLSEEMLSGWVALMFNESSFKTYGEKEFRLAFLTFCESYNGNVNVDEVWQSITDIYYGSTGKLPAKILLQSIKQTGNYKGLYTEIPKDIDVVVSTIHRSKGKEFDTVLLLDSLLSTDKMETEEQRVNYVALSRAKHYIYKIEMDNIYFKTLDDRRCYSSGTAFKTGSHYLRFFEIGKYDDFVRNSFASLPGVQKFLRGDNRNLIGKEVFLRKKAVLKDGTVVYDLVLRENNMVLATTSQNFSDDLSAAIREIKHLPYFVNVYENIFPNAFSGIYITDIASEIGIVQGNEQDVVEYDGLVTWNTILVEGYAKAEY